MTTGRTSFDDHFVAEYPKIVAELDYVLGSHDLARDVAQEAFVRQYASWTRLARYDKPGAWVRRVAIRIAFRTRKLFFRTVDWDAAPEITAPLHDSDAVMDVRRAVLELPPGQRSAIVLRYFRNLPDPEIAGVMGIKESTVRAHLHQGRKGLAERLTDYGPQ